MNLPELGGVARGMVEHDYTSRKVGAWAAGRNGGGHDGNVGAREADPGAVGQMDFDRRGGPR
jgi:hypothetical protein